MPLKMCLKRTKSAEKVSVTRIKFRSQIHSYKNKMMYVPKRSSRLLREFSYKKQLQTEGPDCLDMLGAKLEHLQSHDKVLSNEMEQLKMSFEHMAERYMAQKREKEAQQNIIQELNLCILQQLNAADGEKVLCHITFKRHSKKSMMRIVYSKPGRRRRQPSREDMKLCNQGKILRFNEMF